MKITSKQYARGLYELVVDKGKAEAERLISEFVKFLYHNNDLVKADQVISELEILFKEASGELSIEVISARKLSKTAKETLKSYLEHKSGAKDVSFLETIDPEIMGGFIARYDDKVVDSSLRSSLSKFSKQFSN